MSGRSINGKQTAIILARVPAPAIRLASSFDNNNDLVVALHTQERHINKVIFSKYLGYHTLSSLLWSEINSTSWTGVKKGLALNITCDFSFISPEYLSTQHVFFCCDAFNFGGRLH